MGLGLSRWEVSWLSHTLTPKQWLLVASAWDAHLQNFPRVCPPLALTKHSARCLLALVWSPKDLAPWGKAPTSGLSHGLTGRTV